VTASDIRLAASLRRRPRILAIALVTAGLAVVFAANAHLLYSALKSQPACVPHLKGVASDPPGAVYRPAESSC
jgi:hypothetical protein